MPPLVIVSLLFALGATLSLSIRITIWAGAASLGGWGFVAGRRVGLTGWRLVLAVLAGLVVGAVVLAIRVLLQPGKVGSGRRGPGPCGMGQLPAPLNLCSDVVPPANSATLGYDQPVAST